MIRAIDLGILSTEDQAKGKRGDAVDREPRPEIVSSDVLEIVVVGILRLDGRHEVEQNVQNEKQIHAAVEFRGPVLGRAKARLAGKRDFEWHDEGVVYRVSVL